MKQAAGVVGRGELGNTVEQGLHGGSGRVGWGLWASCARGAVQGLHFYPYCQASLGKEKLHLTMHSPSQQRTQKYIQARQQHPAWLLLASRRAPLMLSCLEALFEHQREGFAFEYAVQELADMLRAPANRPECGIG